MKYLFTSERLSIQVHPSDDQARDLGLPGGKTECWFVLDAQADATLGLGLNREASKEEIQDAALDGSIEQLIDWRPVAAGDFFLVPAGTIHAIGAGITLLEFQQNQDVTFRLYDYGRPRELHLEDGIAVSSPRPYAPGLARTIDLRTTTVLEDGPEFRIAYAIAEDADQLFAGQRRWIMPLQGSVADGTDRAGPGDCLLVEAGERIEASGSLLVGAEPLA